MSRSPTPLRSSVELVLATVADSLEDRVPGLAAEIAFFAVLSLPPLLLTVAASLGFLSDELTTRFVDGLTFAARETFSADTVENVIAPTLDLLVSEQRTDIVSLGFAITVFSVSRAVWVVMRAVAIAYDLETGRSPLRQRIYALLATLALLVTAPVLVTMLVTGPGFGERIDGLALMPVQVGPLWAIGYWPTVVVATIAVVTTLYHLAAPWWTPWRRDLPGAVLTVAIWVGGSAGLRVYTARALEDQEVYGPLAGPLVVLVWLYVLAFAILLGAELNAEFERLHPSPEQRRAPASDRLRARVRDVRGRRTAGTRVPGLADLGDDGPAAEQASESP